MNLWRSAGYRWCAALAAVAVGGCSGGMQTAANPAPLVAQGMNSPSGFLAIGRPQYGRAAARSRPDASRSWMAPDAKNQTLLYVSDSGTFDVYAYSYPKGTLEGTLTGFDNPQGECVDSAGDVFVTNSFKGQILEYAHGGTTPIATLSDPNQYPIDCAVDPTTGNLAVSNYFAKTGGPGSVAIYQGAQGTPVYYAESNVNYEYYLGYDSAGNLYVDGLDSENAFHFAEISHGATAFSDITVHQSIGFPGGVLWDGKNVALGDQDANVVYRLKIAGTSATVSGTTPLSGATYAEQFWLTRFVNRAKHSRATRLIVPNYFTGGADVGTWTYPAGGSPTKTITMTAYNTPVGTTLSEAP